VECGRQLQADDAQAGTTAQCPLCHRQAIIPVRTQILTPFVLGATGSRVEITSSLDPPQEGEVPPTADSSGNPFSLRNVRRISSEADAALILGLLSFLVIPVVSPIALAYGISALRLIKAESRGDDEPHPQRGKAITGIALGSLGLLFLLLQVVVFVLVVLVAFGWV